MSYCQNCGIELKPDSNYCTNCGTKALNVNTSNDILKTKSLENKEVESIDNQNHENDKSKKTFASNDIDEHIPKEKIIDSLSEEVKGKKYTFAKRMMMFYLVINIVLFSIKSGFDEIIGLLIFSIIVFWDFIVFISNKGKKKPFSIVTKIFLVLQMLLAVSLVMNNYEYFFNSIYSAIAVMTFVLLSIVNVSLLIWGNKI